MPSDDLDRAALAELRARTAAGLADCIRALREAAGDVAMAIEVLARYERERTAQTRANRAAVDGWIAELTSGDHDQTITDYVAMGFYTAAEIVEIVAGQAPRSDRRALAAHVSVAIERKRGSIATWPTHTACETLDRSFAGLARRDLVVVQNAGVTSSDGLECVAELGSKRSVGYCYYTLQDLRAAVQGRGLALAFGAMRGGSVLEDDAQHEAIGQLICDMLDGIGEVSWSGRAHERIVLPTLVWQRRGPEIGAALPIDGGIHPRYFAR